MDCRLVDLIQMSPYHLQLVQFLLGMESLVGGRNMRRVYRSYCESKKKQKQRHKNGNGVGSVEEAGGGHA